MVVIKVNPDKECIEQGGQILFVVHIARAVNVQQADEILPVDGNHLGLGRVDFGKQLAVLLLQRQQAGFRSVCDDAHFNRLHNVGS